MDKQVKEKLARWWSQYSTPILAALFVIVFSTLMFLKHESFNTRTYDFARFDQAIWNTLHGRFLFSSILNMSILGNHFSPFLALLSPLFVLWNDARILFLVQTVSLAMTGVWLQQIVRLKRPSLAPWLLLAFYLNPTVHEITLFEFRRIVPAMPFIAMALYALFVRNRKLLLVGLGLALLCQEDVGFVVLMVGFYLLAFERDWKWGIPIMLLGGAWVIVVSLWVIPAFAPASKNTDVYPQMYYFEFLGDSYGEIINTLLREPGILFSQIISQERILAVGRILLPLSFILPFVAPDWLLICLPTVTYLLLSSEPRLYRLETWHPATIMPVLFAAAAVGLGRLPARWANRAAAALLAMTLLGYLLFSPAPLGGTYEAGLYDVTGHHRLADQIVAAVPTEASVATQPFYVPHLSHREHIYHYPWIVIGEENTDYLLLDRLSDPYPLSRDELNAQIDSLLANPAYVVELEGDGIYLFRRQKELLVVERVLDGTMKLVSAEVTPGNEQGLFAGPSPPPARLKPGQQVRIDLYWEALAAPNAERTVSVRIIDGSGALIAQQDNWPAQGTKPTSWWQQGWRVRDVYYLTIPANAQAGPASLSVLVYDSYTQEILRFDQGEEMIEIAPLHIVP